MDGNKELWEMNEDEWWEEQPGAGEYDDTGEPGAGESANEEQPGAGEYHE